MKRSDKKSFLTAALVVLLVLLALLAGCSGGSDGTILPTSQTTLSAPTMPTATASDKTVVISWNTVPDAEEYNLYLSNTPNIDPATATKIEHVMPPYAMTGLTNGTTYYFRVQAVCKNTNRLSETSAELSATPKTPPPGAPAEVTAMAGDTFVVLQWVPVEGATSYNIYWGTATGVSKMSEFHFSAVTSPYIHYIPTDLAATTGAGCSGSGGGGHTSTTGTTTPATVLKAVQSATTSATCSGSGGGGGKGKGKGMKSTAVMLYYAVTAVDAYGQESKVSAEVGAAPKTPGGMPGGEEDGGYGSNLAVPLIFAEGYGLGGLPVTDESGNKLYANTGLRNSTTPPALGRLTGAAEPAHRRRLRSTGPTTSPGTAGPPPR